LYNKSSLENRLLDTPQDFTLILLNINSFSYINTAYGFDTGNQLLINVADILVEHFDTHSVYRFNSDEYAVLFASNIILSYRSKKISSIFIIT